MKKISALFLFLAFLVFTACSAKTEPGRIAEANFEDVASTIYGEKSVEFYAALEALNTEAFLPQDTASASFLSDDQYGDKLFEIYKKYFGDSITESYLQTLLAQQKFVLLSEGSIESLTFERAEERRINYSLIVSFSNGNQANDFTLSGSFQFDDDGKITFYRVNDNRAFQDFYLSRQDGNT